MSDETPVEERLRDTAKRMRRIFDAEPEAAAIDCGREAIAALREIVHSAHAGNCSGWNGPEGEEWMEPEHCDCAMSRGRDAVMATKRDDAATVTLTAPVTYKLGLRDWFAGKVLSGVVSESGLMTVDNDDVTARRCYELADAMMRAREAR